MRLALALALVACESAAPVAGPGLVETTRTFDGFALGDSFARVMVGPPYDKPCDDDPVEQGNYRAVVYAARPCRGTRFPGDTSAVFILDRRPAVTNHDERIRAFGWMGGNYYADKIPLPLTIGDPLDRAIAVFGTPRASFDLRTLHVDWLEGEVSVLSERKIVVGIVFGDMPRTGDAERWRVFDQMYRRYTPRPIPPGAASAEDCRRLVAKREALGGPATPADELDRAADSCRIETTATQVACALAAATLEDMTKCAVK